MRARWVTSSSAATPTCWSCARHRQYPGPHGVGPGRRSRLDRIARHRQAGAGGARDERAHVDACRTVANVETLKKRGITFIGPNDGAMACNEYRSRRMSEPEEIVAAIETMLAKERPLAGKRAARDVGSNREAIDPVRYISNHSSGKQGHAIAAALARLGAEVTLVSGPVAVADPVGVKMVKISPPTRCWRPT